MAHQSSALPHAQWRPPADSIGEMPRRGRTVPATMPVLGLETLFLRDPVLSSVVVAQPGREPACMTRGRFFAELTGPMGFGRSLYARQRLSAMPQPQTLMLAARTSVMDAAASVLARPDECRYEDFIVRFEDGSYGTLCVADLFAELAHTHAFHGLHDVLTGLANRRMFVDRLRDTRDPASAQASDVAVLFVDVDDFKTINDALGHDVGNEVLIAVASRLRATVAADDTVSRLGGDEFGVLISGVRCETEVLGTVEQIVSELGQPLWIGEKKVALSASVGVALSRDETSPETLLRNADLAMYAAKRRHKGCHRFYEQGMHAEARARLDLRAQLDGALERGELFVLYQPIVDLRRKEIVGAEALLRWRRPGEDGIGPDRFIPLCEQTGLIVTIGRWVLQEACRQAMRWSASGQGHRPLKISVNVSPRQLRDPTFVGTVAQVLSDTCLDPGDLILEITEGVFIRDMEIVLERLAELKRIGVRLALDDFGAGFSSLGYLSRMPIDILKLDRTFVADLGSEDERGLLAGVVALARSLELVTIAEGVETASQALELEAAGCSHAQGFLFSRPMDALMLGRLASETTKLPVHDTRAIDPPARHAIRG